MNDFRLPLGDWVEDVVDFVTNTFSVVFDVIATIFGGFYDGVNWVLVTPPFWVIMIVLVVLAWIARKWTFAIGTLIGLLVIYGVNQWENAMNTLALTLVAAVIAVIIAIPVGIWAARSSGVSAVVKPILDFLQTMPAFVYLIPAIILFSVGVVPGIVATILFAVAPGVRLTELGIRGVDSEVVEAGQAFGASPRRILVQIQLPLARPSIMAGVNQVIMLSLSMVVIASMVGAPGLGKDIIQALSRVDTGLGFEAGLSVVILAIILDRLTASLGGQRKRGTRAKRDSSEAPAEAREEKDELVAAGPKRAPNAI
ncbi:glycine betaine/proline transport system permease protein [Paramicrobacterium humi]|uniref:Glycine betaine/proline transport system permease protein n=1 Tax=Paramicrobacterium humi TaxID=640635 RepID=A0A1H4LNR6_9MICO|nr:proline/glycine betaine ABC transporter permease [Microbacterium humi]SEB72284.1 glycine betaine/proline transport system permease protein [Microbacterium humi]